MKWIAQALVGALIGFFTTLAILKGDIALPLARYTFAMNIILLIIGIILILATLVYYYQLKKSSQKEAYGEEEDALDEWKYKKFGDFSLFLHAALIINLFFVCMSILTEAPMWVITASGVLLVVSLGLSFIMPSFVRRLYPERAFPAIDDKDYAKKLLEISDEGERHVMLQGLYKSFNSVNLLLLVGMLLLLFYSLATGSSQLFGITIIAVILLLTNVQYLWSVRGK